MFILRTWMFFMPQPHLDSSLSGSDSVKPYIPCCPQGFGGWNLGKNHYNCYNLAMSVIRFPSSRDFSMCIIPCSLNKAEACIARSHHMYQVLAVVGADALWCMNYGYHSSVYSPLYLTHRLKFIFYFLFFYFGLVYVETDLQDEAKYLCVYFHVTPSRLFSYPGCI